MTHVASGLPHTIIAEDLRNAHASWLLPGGADLPPTMESLGHRQLASTQKCVPHLPDTDQRALAAFTRMATRPRTAHTVTASHSPVVGQRLGGRRYAAAEIVLLVVASCTSAADDGAAGTPSPSATALGSAVTTTEPGGAGSGDQADDQQADRDQADGDQADGDGGAGTSADERAVPGLPAELCDIDPERWVALVDPTVAAADQDDALRDGAMLLEDRIGRWRTATEDDPELGTVVDAAPAVYVTSVPDGTS